MKRVSYIIYSVIIALLVFLTFRISLQFGFWKDDWSAVWVGVFHPDYALIEWMHPAGNLEYYFLGKIFGVNAAIWQWFGLFLRFLAALSVAAFAGRLFNSKKAGYMAGVLYATTVIGMDSTVWSCAYVNLIAVVFFCLGLRSWKIYLKDRSTKLLGVAMLWLLLGFFSDIWRAFLLIPLMHYLVWMMPNSAFRTRIVKRFYYLYLSFLFFVPFAAHIAWSIVTQSQISFFIQRHWYQPFIVISKLKYLGNFFNTLFYMITGWFLQLPEIASTGVHVRWQAYAGLIMVMVYIGYILFSKIERHDKKLLGLLLIWIMGFYIPNWLFEPRLTMGISHRYLMISGVGFILLVTYVLIKIRDMRITIFLFLLFIFFNVLTAWRILGEQLVYRADVLIKKNWQIVDNQVAHEEGPVIFLFKGNDPFAQYNVDYSGGLPFVMRRELKDFSQFPIVSNNPKSIRSLVCDDHPSYTMGGRTYTLSHPIPLDHIYSWEIVNSTFIPMHDQVRAQLKKDLCVD